MDPGGHRSSEKRAKKLKREVDAEKAMWVRGTIGTTQFPGDGRPVTPKTLWNAIFLLN